jgi:endogenous inhibitor of DNA gyrase (YacG/DUF329 family)
MMTVRFTQSCPTCGRRIQYRLSLLGQQVQCPHCQSEFVAAERRERSSQDLAPKQIPPIDSLMERVERVLAQTSPTEEARS